ncbi:hypothetical protein K438DRAFT_1769724 [Mycena galopus ATCC 62051]|nr:hypothetical protein K438DRAFT_1769724 [Mycena galopus ATCC 62051]
MPLAVASRSCEETCRSKGHNSALVGADGVTAGCTGHACSWTSTIILYHRCPAVLGMPRCRGAAPTRALCTDLTGPLALEDLDYCTVPPPPRCTRNASASRCGADSRALHQSDQPISARGLAHVARTEYCGLNAQHSVQKPTTAEWDLLVLFEANVTIDKDINACTETILLTVRTHFLD